MPLWSSRTASGAPRGRVLPAESSNLSASSAPHDASSSSVATARMYSEMPQTLHRIAAAWGRHDFRQLSHQLDACADFLDPAQAHLLVYFTGLGGVDLFARILCEPVLLKRENATGTRRVQLAERHYLIESLGYIIRILTELLMCHGEFGWYLYDHSPGLFYRLLELAPLPQLGVPATAMLEHLISSVGPVLEIAKSPVLINLLRTSKDGVLAGLCRVVALLIVPGLALGQSHMASRRLLYPESLLPLKRVQRVIDSNVLWLLGETGLVSRLVSLCEVRAGGIRVQQGNRTMTLVPPDVTSANWAALMMAGGLPAAEGVLEAEHDRAMGADSVLPWGTPSSSRSAAPSDGEESYETEEEELVIPEEAAVPAAGVAQNAEDTSVAGVLDMLQQVLQRLGGGAGGAPRAPVPALNIEPPRPRVVPVEPPDDSLNVLNPNNADAARLVQQMMDEEVLSNSLMSGDYSSPLNFSWFLGTYDSRQRWRVRDPTLMAERDDHRPYLLGYGSSRDVQAVRRFRAINERSLHELFTPEQRAARDTQPHEQFEERRIIVDAQSEILFVLNAMLSTFYFSDVWVQMRACRWVSRACEIYKTAFGLEDSESTLVDVPPHVHLSEELRQLPRFQPPPAVAAAAVAEPDATYANTKAGGVPPPIEEAVGPTLRAWQLPPFAEMLGRDREAYIRDASAQMLQEDSDLLDDSSHQHGPDTIRKLELLRGVHEFWNTQDRAECAMVQVNDIIEGARPLGLQIATTLAENKEDSCVEFAACHSLESYLRCFSFGYPARCVPDNPQTTIAAVLLTSLLEARIYNATRIPGLGGSLTPTKRIDGVFTLLAELMRFHFTNLSTLCRYLRDEVSLRHLNRPQINRNRQNPVILSGSHEEAEELLRCPPLERSEFEPFGRVLLRRIYRFGCDANLFIRVLLFSTTPGLRSSCNYTVKPVQGLASEVVTAPPVGGRVGDVVTGYPVRLAHIRRLSRRVVTTLSFKKDLDRSAVLLDLLEQLSHCPHRLPLEERPYPHLLSEEDRRLLRGEVGLPALGPPPAWSLPLYDEQISEAEGVAHLAPIRQLLLAEPAKLVYSMLCSLHAEKMNGTGRLCVVTTVLLLFMSEATLHGMERAVQDILTELRGLAEPSYHKWAREVQRHPSPAGCSTAATAGAVPHCTCRPTSADADYRCVSFTLYGACRPLNLAERYHQRLGGCFFRNFFRLVCVWIGHYFSCQHYVETLYYSTEIAFGEYKAVALYLLRILPDYFFPALELPQ